MTPLALFLLACLTVFLGCIEAAFSTLMRLSLRLMAERGGRGDRLGRFLDDPLHLFIPVRLLIAMTTGLAGAVIATPTAIHNARAIATLLVGILAFIILCEHLLPMAIVRRDPEGVLDVLLPVFSPLARIVQAGLNVGACEIYLSSGEGETMRCVARAVRSDGSAPTDSGPDPHLLDRAARRLPAARVADGSSYSAAEGEDELPVSFLLRGDARALYIPLRVRERRYGVLRLENPDAMVLDAAQQRFAEALAY